MKVKDIILETTLDEMGLRSYELIGKFDPETKGPFNSADRRLVSHPVAISKAYKFFERSPFNFRVFMSNLPKLRQYRETGKQDENTIRQLFGKEADRILLGHESSITVIYMGNYGVDRVPLTPWVMAHRIGHAIAASTRYSGGGLGGGMNYSYDPMSLAFEAMFTFANKVLEVAYGKSSDSFGELRSYSRAYKYPMNMYAALFNMLGTQRSSRENLIKRPHEFAYELFAQYIKDGHITLNIPQQYKGYGRKAWGRDTQVLHRELNDEPVLQQMVQRFAVDMQHIFDRILRDAVGKIYVM
jgi:hypothetical protein